MYGFVTAVVRPQGVTAVKGGSDQQLGRQQKIAVLVHLRISRGDASRGSNITRTDDGGPGLKRPAGLSQQFPGAQHPGMRGHQRTERPAGKGLPGPFTPAEVGRPTPGERTWPIHRTF